MAIKGGRPHNRRIVPYVFVRDGDGAIDFYKKAFGAELLYRSPMPFGRGVFAQMRIFDSTIQIADEMPEFRQDDSWPAAPPTLGGTSTILEVYVDDLDAAYQRAVDAGGKPTMPPHESFWGDRYAWVTDPFGHIWALSMLKESITPEEVDRRMAEHIAKMAH